MNNLEKILTTLESQHESEKIKMNKKAYLVGVIATRKDPPEFRGAAIFSEENPTVGLDYVFTIAESDGESYGDAVEKLKKDIETMPALWWAKRYLDR